MGMSGCKLCMQSWCHKLMAVRPPAPLFPVMRPCSPIP